MLIHKSHSKKDIIELFSKMKVKIDPDLSKGKIMTDIDEYMDKVIYNEKIKNKTELQDYLKNETTKQRPTIQEKQNIMFKAKKIVKYCVEGCNLSDYTYKTHEEVYNDLISICKWGDIPSVPRACKLYNKSLYCLNHVNPVISDQVEEQMNQKKILKKSYIYNLKIRIATKENPIIVSFD